MHRLLLVAALGCGSALPAQAEPAPSDQFDLAAAWFDALGYPAIEGLPFVRVTTGWWTRVADQEPENTSLLGFLLRDDGTAFRVVTIDLAEIEFRRTPAGTAAHEVVAHDVLPLRDFAKKVLLAATAPDGSLRVGDAEIDGVHPQLSHGVRAFLLARACRGKDADLASRLAAAVHGGDRRQHGSLQSMLAAELGHVSWWRLVLDFGDATIPYRELLARSESFARRFPDSAHIEEAAEMRRVLHRMVAEQAARPAPGNLEAMPQNERIAELVYRLRDQNGLQPGQPASCDVFADPRGQESAAQRLLAEGLAAALALAAVLDDDTFTRSVEYHRDFYFSHRVLRVGEVAQRVLHRSTGEWFRDRAAAETWARQVQEHGEVFARVRSVIDLGSAGAAARLLEIAPERLLGAVREAIAGAHDDRRVAGLVAVAGGLEGAEADRFLLERGKAGGPRARLAAAVALWLRGRRAPGLDAMIALWNDLSDRMPGDHTLATRDLQERVGSILAATNSPRAMAAFAARRAVIGHETILALGGDRPWVTAWWPGHRIDDRVPADFAEAAPDADHAAEDLLAALLDDRAVLIGGYNGSDKPRRCDFAASSLARRWSKHYAFELEVEPARREQQIAAVRSAWRARRAAR